MVSKIKVDEIESSQAGGTISINSVTSDKVQTLTSSSGAISINAANGKLGSITLTESITDIDFTNVPSTGLFEFTLKITQGSSTTYTVSTEKITVNSGSEASSLNKNISAYTATSSVNAVDVLVFTFINASTPLLEYKTNYAEAYVPPQSGLALHWDIYGASYEGSGSSVDDLVGSKNGTVNGATYQASGNYNGSFYFDGSNDDITTSSAPLSSGQTAYSYVAFFHPLQNSTLNQVIVEQNTSSLTSNTRGALFLHHSNGAFGFVGESNDATNVTSFSYGQNYMITLMVDENAASGNWLEIYDNATLAGTASGTNTNLNLGDASFTIGKKIPNGNERFKGYFYQLLVYSRKLTSSEISSIYNGYKSRYGI